LRRWESKHFVVMDGVRQGEYDFVSPLVFSRDGKRYAYTAGSGGKSFVVLDGLEQGKLD
jgi:hypothetical protein